MTKITASNKYGSATVTTKQDDLSLEEMLLLMQNLLSGLGYVLKGELTVEYPDFDDGALSPECKAERDDR